MSASDCLHCSIHVPYMQASELIQHFTLIDFVLTNSTLVNLFLLTTSKCDCCSRVLGWGTVALEDGMCLSLY